MLGGLRGEVKEEVFVFFDTEEVEMDDGDDELGSERALVEGFERVKSS